MPILRYDRDKTVAGRRMLSRLWTDALHYATRHPLFVVTAVVSADEPATAGPEDEPSVLFRLRPTGALWLWVAIGLLMVSFAVADGLLWAGFGTVVCTIWVTTLLKRLQRLSGWARTMNGQTADFFRHSPYARARRAVMGWLPAAVACLLGSTVSLAVAISTRESQITRLYGHVELLGCAAALIAMYALAYGLHKSTLALPSLDAWYRELPSTVKPLVDGVTLRRTKYPSSTWRDIPDVSREVNDAGISLALFGEDKNRPIWRRSASSVLWYFAPILLPLMALILAPLVFNAIRGLPGMDDGSKLLYGVGSLVWATWSVCFFLGMGTRDFTSSMPFSGGAQHGLLADLVAFPNRSARSVAAQFFVGAGATVFQLLLFAVVPAYAGYLGLFGSPKDPAAPQIVNNVSNTVSAPVFNNAKVQVPPQCVGGQSASTAKAAELSASANIKKSVKSRKREQQDCNRTDFEHSAPPSKHNLDEITDPAVPVLFPSTITSN